MRWRELLGAAVVMVPFTAQAQTEAPLDAKAYLISPQNGERMKSPFTVRFGLRGMGVTHAGDTAKNMGHHHLLVDVTEPLDPTEPIPTGRKHLHFGTGQTETELNLEPGKHTLQLVLGDAEHKQFRPNVMSDKVSVTVVGENETITRKSAPRKRILRHGRKNGRASLAGSHGRGR
jgi:hypothetical protein